MKNIFYKTSLILFAILLFSCSSDDDNNDFDENLVDHMHKFYTVSENNYLIDFYSEKPQLTVGYNKLAITIKDEETDEFIDDAELSWKPVMHMEGMSHAGPHGHVTNPIINEVYEGFLVFQMAGNETEYWELTLNYEVKGETFEKTIPLDVRPTSDGRVNLQSFEGTDEVHYVLAYKEPQIPKVATNDMEAMLFKMEDMMNFSIVEDYTIALDPRMPSMGNHSSPNNQDLEYNPTTQIYRGKLSLTMSGYWMLNLKLLNADGDVLKGEDITEDHPESSLYFEIEF